MNYHIDYQLGAIPLGSNMRQVDWNSSTVRLPTYVYSDVLTAFYKRCNYYQQQQNDDILRFTSRARAAKSFFQDVLLAERSSNQHGNGTLHVEAFIEIFEAFWIYICTYFSEGQRLIKVIRQIWVWICEDPSRLLWFDVTVLQNIIYTLADIFFIAQKKYTIYK